MPGNTVKINNFNGLEFYVGDSKMEGLLEYLNRHGIKKEDSEMIKSIILCQKCTQPLRSHGGESGVGQNGFTEHFYCEKCEVGIDVMVTYTKEQNVKASAEVVKNE